MQIINAGLHPESIVDRVHGLKPAKVIIVDAADFGAAAGQVSVIPQEAIPQSAMSTHMIPMSVVAKLIQMDTAADIVFIGIQPGDVAYGQGLSDEVKASAEELIRAIKEAYYA